MHIKIVYPFFDVYGGAERIILALAQELCKKHIVEIYTSWMTPSFKTYVKGYSITKLRITPRNTPFFGKKFNPLLINDMLRLAKRIKGKCDVLVSSSWPSNIATYYSKCEARLKLFICFEPDNGLYHNQLFGKDSEMLKKMDTNQRIKAKVAFTVFLPLRKLDKKIVRSQDYILVLSDHIKEQVKKIFGKSAYDKTYRVLHDFVDTSKFYPKKRNTVKATLAFIL
jgi:glycosyltransferase involved in cell wall biosynthesis